MSVRTLVKSIQDIMRKDVGVVLARTDRAWKGGDAKLALNAHPAPAAHAAEEAHQ